MSIEGPETMSVLFGELRSILASQAPREASFARLMDLLEAASEKLTPSQQLLVFQYLEDHLSHWQPSQRTYLAVYTLPNFLGLVQDLKIHASVFPALLERDDVGSLKILRVYTPIPSEEVTEIATMPQFKSLQSLHLLDSYSWAPSKLVNCFHVNVTPLDRIHFYKLTTEDRDALTFYNTLLARFLSIGDLPKRFNLAIAFCPRTHSLVALCEKSLLYKLVAATDEGSQE